MNFLKQSGLRIYFVDHLARLCLVDLSFVAMAKYDCGEFWTPNPGPRTALYLLNLLCILIMRAYVYIYNLYIHCCGLFP